MAFEPLSQEELQQFEVPTQVAGQLASVAPLAGFEPLSQQEASQIARGGIGVPVSRDEARRIAAQRLVGREREAGFRPGDLILRSEAQQLAQEAGIPLGDIGEVASTSQFAPTLQGRLLEALTGARQLASATTFGTAGALGRGIEDLVLNEAQQRVLGSQALRERAPVEALAGETIGGLVPTGLVGRAVLQPGASVLQRAVAGARVGAPIGAVSGAARTVEEQGLETDLSDLITNTLIGTGVGTAVGGGLPIAASGLSKSISGTFSALRKTTQPIKTLQDAGILRSPEAIAADILNPSGGGEVRELAEDVLQGKVLQGFQNIKQTGAFKDFPSLIESGKNTLKKLIPEVNAFIAKNPTVRIDTNDAAEAMLNTATRDVLLMERNPEVVDMILNNAAAISKEFSLADTFARLNSINTRHQNYFTASVKGQTTKLQDAEYAADEVMRKYLSRKLNAATEGLTGLERNPFREHGLDAFVRNNTSTANSSFTVNGGTGVNNATRLNASGVQIALFSTNMVAIATNSLVRVVTLGPNTSSRGQGIVVSSINTVTNSLIQPFFGTYEGAPTPVTWPIAYAVPPTGGLGSVVVTTTQPGGTALLNDTVWVTNVTTTGCVVGYRTAGGSDSGATITFNGISLGRQ